MAHGRVAIAKEDIGAGAFFQHVGEIFRRHDRIDIVDDPARNGSGSLGRVAGFLLVVDRGRVARRPDHLCRCAKGGSGGLRHLAHPLFRHRPVFGVERAHGAVQPRGMGNDVGGRAVGFERAHGQHHPLDRVHVARHDGMERDHDLRGDQRRVHGHVRRCGMAALAGHDDLEFIGRGQQRPGPDRKFARGQTGHVVQAIDLLDAPPVHQPILAHGLAARAAFLGGLEDQHHGAIEIPRLGQVFRGPEQDRGVPVMTTGMHLARNGRGIVHPRCLVDRQRVHVGAKSDHPALGVGLSLDDGHHPRLADARRDVRHPHLLQPVHDEGGGFMHLVHQFGVLVQVTAPARDFGLHFGEAVLHGHGAVSCQAGIRRSTSSAKKLHPKGIASSLKLYSGW